MRGLPAPTPWQARRATGVRQNLGGCDAQAVAANTARSCARAFRSAERYARPRRGPVARRSHLAAEACAAAPRRSACTAGREGGPGRAARPAIQRREVVDAKVVRPRLARRRATRAARDDDRLRRERARGQARRRAAAAPRRNGRARRSRAGRDAGRRSRGRAASARRCDSAVRGHPPPPRAAASVRTSRARGTKAQPVVEPERAARDRLRVAGTELVRVDHEAAAAVQRAERAQHLRPQERRLAAAERIEDVDAGVRLPEERRHAAVADRHAVGEQQVAGVRLQREALARARCR